ADMGALQAGWLPPQDAAGAFLFADRLLRLDCRKHLDVPRRLGLPAAAHDLAGGVLARHQFLVFTGHCELHHCRRFEARARPADGGLGSALARRQIGSPARGVRTCAARDHSGGQPLSRPSRSIWRTWSSVTAKRSATSLRDWATDMSWS